MVQPSRRIVTQTGATRRIIAYRGYQAVIGVVAVGPYPVALQVAVGVVGEGGGVEGGVLVEAVGGAALGGIGKVPVALRVERVGRGDFAALVADVAEAQVVGGAGKVVCEVGQVPLRVIAVRAGRTVAKGEGGAPGEVVPGVGGQCQQGYGAAFF